MCPLRGFTLPLLPDFAGKSAAAAPAAQADIASQLAQLAGLRKSGDLSEEEFDAAKKRLIS